MSDGNKITGDDPVKAFAALPTSVVSDALDRLGIKGQCTSISAVGSHAGKICGRAFTVQFMPCGGPDARTPNGDIGDYIDDVPAGYVVALDNRGMLDCSVWDEVMTKSARNRGIAGTVIDGVCREGASDSARQYPLFARGSHMRNGKDRVRVEAYNLAIVIGGARIECDDILLGDEDGLLVIPRDYVKQVLAAAHEIAATRRSA
jgi:4-hydroxy-4-methyl-2-oxoglutarate aldolase